MGKLSNLFDDYLLFKKCIKVYPFLMKDYDLFEEVTSILLFDKNKIPDIKIVKMSYLKFLLSVVPYIVDDKGNKPYVDMQEKINKLLNYVFKDQEYQIGYTNDQKIIIRVKTNLNEFDNSNLNDVIPQYIDINEQDFNNLKNLILNQNAIPTIDETLHPDLRKALEENMQYMAEKQGYNEGTIEEQVISYKCEMKLFNYKQIKNMSIYQFRQELLRLDLIKDFQIYKTAEMSGMVTFSKAIPHWRSHISNVPDYSNLLIDKKVLDSKMDEVLNNKY